MPKLVDDLTLEQWRRLDVLHVLEKLGCYAKRDVSFIPIKAKDTVRYHVNANGAEWELLVTGPTFLGYAQGKRWWRSCRPYYALV
jgi:hypothetical protein